MQNLRHAFRFRVLSSLFGTPENHYLKMKYWTASHWETEIENSIPTFR